MLIVLELLQQLKGLLQKYGKYSFNQTTVNFWKYKFKGGASNVMFKKAERPNPLESNLIKKILLSELEELKV